MTMSPFVFVEHRGTGSARPPVLPPVGGWRSDTKCAQPGGELHSTSHNTLMLAKFTGWGLLAMIRLLTGAQARWWGCPPKAEQRIYFANHQSHLDLVMIWAALPEELRSITRPIAAKDYWTKSKFKQWVTSAVFNAVYVERERKEGEDP